MRKIRQIHEPERADMDDLVTYRALPTRTMPIDRLDPFLFLNHHGHQIYPPGNDGLPFGPHPHRGFETVTFILSGELMHQDTGGFKSVIGPGGIQWMTAGSGLMHSELSPDEFKQRGGDLEILQLWVNLPARLKMTKPNYVGLQKPQIPTLELDGGKVRVNLVSGQWDETRAPIQSLTDVHLSTIEFRAGAKLSREIPQERTIFFYVVRGDLNVNGTSVGMRNLVEFDNHGTSVQITASTDSLILLGHAVPYREPVVSYGPFVMNTQQEIIRAVEDFRAGKFGVWKD